jgi:hypothetical protein
MVTGIVVTIVTRLAETVDGSFEDRCPHVPCHKLVTAVEM